MSRGNDPGGDLLRGAYAGVGEQYLVLCAVVIRYVCGGLAEPLASAGTPRREGGIGNAPCEDVSVARGGQRR